MLPLCPKWPVEHMRQLELDQYETGKSAAFGGLDQNLVRSDGVLRTALHGWANQLTPCPCKCRKYIPCLNNGCQNVAFSGPWFGLRVSTGPPNRFFRKHAIGIHGIPMDDLEDAKAMIPPVCFSGRVTLMDSGGITFNLLDICAFPNLSGSGDIIRIPRQFIFGIIGVWGWAHSDESI